MLKRVAAGACALIVVGCGQGSSATSTASPSPVPVPVSKIDSLIVAIGQIPGGLDSDGGGVTSAAQDKSDPACPLPGLGNPSALRSARYSGVGNLFVVQEVAIYPDAASAHAALQPVIDGLNSCKGKAGAPAVDQSTAAEVSWHAQGFSPVSGETSTTYAADTRVVNNVVLKVTAGLFDNPQQVAASVADKIAAKVAAAA